MRILVGAAFLAAFVLTPGAAAWDAGDETACPVAGAYRNQAYGFKVELPAGARGCPNSPIGLSDHGVAIALAWPPDDRWIECFAAYNATDEPTLKAFVDDDLARRKEIAGAADVEVTSRARFVLDGLEAERVVLNYDDKTGKRVAEEAVYVLRPAADPENGPSYEYEIRLTAPPDRFASGRAAFEQVLASWRWIAPER